MWIDQGSDGCIYDTVDCYHKCQGCEYGVKDKNEVEMKKEGKSDMKYLGQWMDAWCPLYNVISWDNGNYMLCPADSLDAQVKCLHYAPFDRIDRYCKWYDGNTCIIYEEKE